MPARLHAQCSSRSRAAPLPVSGYVLRDEESKTTSPDGLFDEYFTLHKLSLDISRAGIQVCF